MIKGISDGYGNGKLSIQNTLIEDQYFILTAGEEYKFNLTLRTPFKKIYNRDVNVSDIKLSEDGTEFLDLIKVEPSGVKGRFVVTIIGTKATKRETNAYIKVSI